MEAQKIVLSQTNCFLLKAADGPLLVDCGNAGDERRLMSKLGRMGLDPLSIRYLLLTHHHSDHCGLLPFLLRANPGLTIIMSETCANYLESGRHFRPAGERYASKALGLAIGMYGRMCGKLADTFPPYFRRVGNIIWREGDGVLTDFAGIPGRLVHTPGHTADSLSLIVGEDAFVGDAARNMLNICGMPHAPILYFDRKLLLESWENILSAGAKTIHPAHGPSFSAERLRRGLKKAGFSI